MTKKTVGKNGSLSLSDFVSSTSEKVTTSSRFNASKMSGKPCSPRQAFSVAGFTLESFISAAFHSDPREDIQSQKIIKLFNNRLISRIGNVIHSDTKFDSDACQPYFKNKDKALPKGIVVKVTKAFKSHNQLKGPVDNFLNEVETKV